MEKAVFRCNKKQIIIFLFLIVATVCFAQPRESDIFYRKGVEYVDNRDYAKAIEFFTMCQKIDTVQTESFNLSNNWHYWIGYCYNKLGETDSARRYSSFYKYRPYNRFEIQGIDSVYGKCMVYCSEGKYDEALKYLDIVENGIISTYGSTNMYLNEIWKRRAIIFYVQNRIPNAINILTKVWHNYQDSLGICLEWRNVGNLLIRCYSQISKGQDLIKSERIDSNTVMIRRTDTRKAGLLQELGDSSLVLILPMEYNSINKIDDRFFYVNIDWGNSFFVDFITGNFSKPISGLGEDHEFKHICTIDSVPVFHRWHWNGDIFVDFRGNINKCPETVSYKGIENDSLKFELDSVFYTIPKDSIMLSNNIVKYIFPSKTKSNSKYENYYVHHIYNKDYVVVHNKIDTEIGLLKRSDSGIIQLLSCEYDEITPIFDDHHFIIKQGQFCYIFNTKTFKKTKVSAPTDGIASALTLDEEYNSTISFNYNGKATIFCRDYRPFAIDIEGNVYHFPIGSWIEQVNDKYVFHYGNDFVSDINNVPLGKMREYRIVKNNIFPTWRFSVRMDYPTDNSKLSDNVRCWMSSLLSSTNYTYIPTDKKSPIRMFLHYAYKGLNNAIINNDGNVIYTTGGDSIVYNIHQQDYDAYRMWEDDEYVTYICGDAWDGGGPHGDAYTCYSTFSKMSGEILNAIDFFDQGAGNYIHKLLYDLIIEEQVKRTGYNDDDIKSEFEFTPDNCPVGHLALTPKGVVFQYRAYELGAYSLGSFSFTVPYEKLKSVLKIHPMSNIANNVFIESLQKSNKYGEVVFLDKESHNERNTISLVSKKYGKKSGEYLDLLLQHIDKDLEKNDHASTIIHINEYIDLITSITQSVWTINQGKEKLFLYYLGKKNYDKAKRLGLDHLRRYNNTHYMNEMLDRYNYSELLSQIGSVYNQIGRADSALFYQEKSLYYGSEYDIDSYKTASLYAYKCKQYSKSNEFAKYVLYGSNKRESWMDKLINAFKEATSYNRMELRNKQIPWYQNFLPDLAYKTNDTIMVKSAYNAQLISKNLLLNTEQSLRSAILSSQDTTLINPYLRVQLLKKELANITNDKKLNNEVKKQRASSVRDEINDLERKLIDKSKLYGDYIKKLKIDIDQVSNYLRHGEMAIEFAVSSDSVYYAIIIKGNNSIPQIIKLCTASELTSKKQDIFNTIWMPLLSNTDDVKTIYFSPAGELYNLPIEYANSTDNHTIGEKYEIYRLSSTREIVISRDSTYTIHNKANNAVLYGYLDYYADENYMNIGLSLDKKAFGNNITTRFSKKGRGLRANVGRLEYSKAEIHDIDSLLVSNNYATVDSIFENGKGTETSLKNYSQRHMGILHLATHGFYISKKEMENYKDLDFLSLDNVDTDEIEDKELVRSGLLFAGANHTLEGDGVIPEGYDDGILTALEVASLDLIGLDLVVLSACQTGQGDLGDDGVLGLQRGFKKAGANSILMSLWKVEDEATQILMTQFYKNLVSGQSKRQSLQSAQRYLREYNAGQYDKPEYWAAFILLDAIN